MKTLSILYIEDEKIIRENITEVLKLLCKEVYSFSNSEDGFKAFTQMPIDIIVSDINLPRQNGLEFSKRVRERDKTIPIILLTAQIETSYLLEATKLKLIDYLIKPIDFTQLQNALMRSTQEIIENGKYQIHFQNGSTYTVQNKSLYLFDEKINLTSKEIELLEYFIQHKNRVISQEELQFNIWEDNYDITDSAFKTLLNKLRQKIGKNSIKNISGVGYRVILK